METSSAEDESAEEAPTADGGAEIAPAKKIKRRATNLG